MINQGEQVKRQCQSDGIFAYVSADFWGLKGALSPLPLQHPPTLYIFPNYGIGSQLCNYMASHSDQSWICFCCGLVHQKSLTHPQISVSLLSWVCLKPMLDPSIYIQTAGCKITLDLSWHLGPWSDFLETTQNNLVSSWEGAVTCYPWKWEWTFHGLWPALHLRTSFVVHLSKHATSMFHTVSSYRRWRFTPQSLCGVLEKTRPQCEILEDISGGPSLEFSPEITDLNPGSL